MSDRERSLEERVSQLEFELGETRLELAQLKQLVQPQAKPKEEETPAVSLPSGTPVSKPADDKPSPAKQNKKQAPKIGWDEALQRIWLPRVFLFVLIIGFIWGFVAAVEEGWITEPVRIAIGFFTSAALWLLGNRQSKSGRKPLGVTLTAGSLILLALTTFAMNTLYGYIGFWTAFLFFAVWIALGLWASRYYRSEVLGILITLGGYLVPFMLEGAEYPNHLLFYLYELGLYGTFLIYGRRQSFTYLYYTSYFLLHAVLFVYSVLAGPFYTFVMLILAALNLAHLAVAFVERDRFLHYSSFAVLHVLLFVYLFEYSASTELAVIIVLIQHLVLVGLYFFFSKREDREVYGGLLASLYLLASWIGITWTAEWMVWVLAGLAVLHAGLLVYSWNKKGENRAYAAVLTTVSLGLYLYHAFYSDFLPLLYVLEGAAGMLVGAMIGRKFQWGLSAAVFIIGALGVVDQYPDFFFSTDTAGYLLLLAVLGGMVYGRKHDFFLAWPLYSKAVVLAFCAFILYTLTVYTQFAFQYASLQTIAIAVSASWLFYAIALIAAGRFRGYPHFQTAGTIMLFIVLLKVTFVDITISSVALKAMLFVVLGSIGLLVSRLLYKSDKEK